MENFSKEKTEIRKPPTYLYYLAGFILLFLIGFAAYYFGYYRYFVKPFGGLTNQVENVKQKIVGLKKETNENRAINDQKILIDVPKEDEAIGNPAIIKGQAEVFEATFNIRIKDANGKILGEAMAMTQEGQTMSPYSVNLSYATSTTEFGLIEAFDYSAKDGSIQDLVSVKVKFANYSQPSADETANWQIYRNEKYGFEVKYPKDWKENKIINDENNIFLYLVFEPSSKNYSFIMKVNMFGELTPLLPEWEFTEEVKEVSFFGDKLNEKVYSSESNKQHSFHVRFCINNNLIIKKPEPDYKIDEANLSCEKGYNLFDINLFCKDQSKNNCENMMNQILSTFKFIAPE